MTLHVALNHRTRYEYDRPVQMGPQVDAAAARAAQPHARLELRAAHRARRPLLELAAGSARQFPRARRVPREGRRDSSSRSISSPTWPCAIRSTFSSSPRRRRFRSSTSPALRKDLEPYLDVEPAGRRCVRAMAERACARKPPARTIDFLVELNQRLQARHRLHDPHGARRADARGDADAALRLVPRLGLAARRTSCGTWDSRAASFRAT